jgi:hypothetical protein
MHVETPSAMRDPIQRGNSTRRAILLVAIALALLVPPIASAAAQEYAEGWWHWPDQGAGSSFSTGWRHNWFLKDSPGYLTTVTFIDNSGYDWHATVRNSFQTTATAWQSSAVKKGHCKSNTTLDFYGRCVVATN